MKLEILKKDLAKIGAIYGIVMLVVVVLTYLAHMYNSDLQEELGQIQRNTQAIISEAAAKAQEYDKLLKAYENYKNIPEHRLPTDHGYASSAERIRVSRPIIEDLENRFRMVDIKVLLSQIVEEEQDKKKRSDFAIINDQLSIEFQAMSDELVYSFIHALIDEFPGYLQLKQFKINRTSEVTDEILQDLSNTGEMVPLVRGTMELDWRTIRDNTATETGDKNAG